MRPIALVNRQAVGPGNATACDVARTAVRPSAARAMAQVAIKVMIRIGAGLNMAYSTGSDSVYRRERVTV